jgi:hypothetical protein
LALWIARLFHLIGGSASEALKISIGTPCSGHQDTGKQREKKSGFAERHRRAVQVLDIHFTGSVHQEKNLCVIAAPMVRTSVSSSSCSGLRARRFQTTQDPRPKSIGGNKAWLMLRFGERAKCAIKHCLTIFKAAHSVIRVPLS